MPSAALPTTASTSNRRLRRRSTAAIPLASSSRSACSSRPQPLPAPPTAARRSAERATGPASARTSTAPAGDLTERRRALFELELQAFDFAGSYRLCVSPRGARGRVGASRCDEAAGGRTRASAGASSSQTAVRGATS